MHEIIYCCKCMGNLQSMHGQDACCVYVRITSSLVPRPFERRRKGLVPSICYEALVNGRVFIMYNIVRFSYHICVATMTLYCSYESTIEIVNWPVHNYFLSENYDYDSFSGI